MERWPPQAVAVAALVGAVPAQAAVPDHGTFSSIEDYVDDEVCAPEGFAVSVHQVETGDFQVFLDAEGNFLKAIVHTPTSPTSRPTGSRSTRATGGSPTSTRTARPVTSASPCTSRGRAASCSRTRAGSASPPTAAVTYVHGPHPQALGETFCSAFTG